MNLSTEIKFSREIKRTKRKFRTKKHTNQSEKILCIHLIVVEGAGKRISEHEDRSKEMI